MPPPEAGLAGFCRATRASLRGLLPTTFKLGPAHIRELDLDGVAGVDRRQTFVKCAGEDEIARAQRKKLVSQAIWLGILCAMDPVL